MCSVNALIVKYSPLETGPTECHCLFVCVRSDKFCQKPELEPGWNLLTPLRYPLPISQPPTAISRVINTRRAAGQWADAGCMPSCQAEFHPSEAVSLNTAGRTGARPLSSAGCCPACVVCLENNEVMWYLVATPVVNRAVMSIPKTREGSQIPTVMFLYCTEP